MFAAFAQSSSFAHAVVTAPAAIFVPGGYIVFEKPINNPVFGCYVNFVHAVPGPHTISLMAMLSLADGLQVSGPGAKHVEVLNRIKASLLAANVMGKGETDTTGKDVQSDKDKVKDKDTDQEQAQGDKDKEKDKDTDKEPVQGDKDEGKGADKERVRSDKDKDKHTENTEDGDTGGGDATEAGDQAGQASAAADPPASAPACAPTGEQAKSTAKKSRGQ